MSLIPIPWEGEDKKIKKVKTKKVKIKIKPIKKANDRDFGFLKITILKFAEYLNNFHKLDIKRIDDLIYKLQKCLLLLQRHKTKMLIKKNLKCKLR